MVPRGSAAKRRGLTRPATLRSASASALLLLATWAPAAAQNYSFDARRIALGGTGGTPNLASDVPEDRRGYTSIVIPLGLVRVLTNVRVFFPTHDEFDFARAVEFATRPMHVTLGGGRSQRTGRSFASDVSRGSVNRDLNAYRGFAAADSIFAEGLAAPNWGKTFVVKRNARGFQGVYTGAGPYFTARADARFDASLVNLLGADADVYIPSASLAVGGGEVDQLALAFTGGYRARFPLPGRSTAGPGRDGLYVAADLHYLHGLRFDSIQAALRLDTDLQGLITPDPVTPPLAIVWETSRSGRGRALDVGTTVVMDRWEFGAGVSGIGNRIRWRDITRHDVTRPSLFGGEFVREKTRMTLTRRFDVPVQYTGDLSYHRETWSVLTEYSRGLQGHSFLAGYEYRLGTTELRTGMRLSQGRWYPSGGVGFRLIRRLAMDVAVFGTKTFLEQQRRPAVAISLRLEGRREPPARPLAPAR